MTNNISKDLNDGKKIEISVVMPCLNEEKSVGVCVKKAYESLLKMNVPAEIIVADNGSSDNSKKVAADNGAIVVDQPEKGYGNAYLKGFASARGKYIIMGDSDDTYDFTNLELWITPLKDEGFDMVMGNRFKGNIIKGAMPWHHKYIGNPILSGILKVLFSTSVGDSHCGMRSFTKDAITRMDLRTTGMEFASEIVIKAVKNKFKIKEIPITLNIRGGGQPHLRSFRDGWRHLRFMLMFSPTYLFLIPGFFLGLLGLIILGGVYLSPNYVFILFGYKLELHWMMAGSVLLLVGFQILNLGFYAKIFSFTSGLDSTDKKIVSWLKLFTLEKGLIIGLLLFLTGFSMLIYLLVKYIKGDFPVEPPYEIPSAIIALNFIVIGIGTFFSSFFYSILGLTYKKK